MKLGAQGLKNRILRAVNAGWGALKHDERVLRSQYNISKADIDRYLKDYNKPTMIEILQWEDQINYYKNNRLADSSTLQQTVNVREQRQNGKEESVSNEWKDVILDRAKEKMLIDKLIGYEGRRAWIVDFLSKKCQPIDLDGICKRLLRNHTKKMIQYSTGYEYNDDELTNKLLIQGRNIISGCDLTDQFPIVDVNYKGKLEMIDELLQIPSEIRNEVHKTYSKLSKSSIDCIFKLSYLLNTEGIQSAMDYLKENPRNIKMMNIMIAYKPNEVLNLMKHKKFNPNFETFIQLLDNCNESKVVINFIQFILKHKIINYQLWISMLRASIRTNNIKIVDAMFEFNCRCVDGVQVNKISNATYEIYDQLAMYYKVRGINNIGLNSEICSLVYNMYKDSSNGDSMMKVVNQWEKISKA